MIFLSLNFLTSADNSSRCLFILWFIIIFHFKAILKSHQMIHNLKHCEKDLSGAWFKNLRFFLCKSYWNGRYSSIFTLNIKSSKSLQWIPCQQPPDIAISHNSFKKAAQWLVLTIASWLAKTPLSPSNILEEWD